MENKTPQETTSETTKIGDTVFEHMGPIATTQALGIEPHF